MDGWWRELEVEGRLGWSIQQDRNDANGDFVLRSVLYVTVG